MSECNQNSHHQNRIHSRAYFKIYAVLSLLCFSLSLFQCTAYFNTYYNAERSFEEAQVIHTKMMRDYPDSIVVTPTAELISKYDRTIEKTNKVFEVFPKSKKWHDDALMLMGKAHFYKREMLKAVSRFRRLEQEFPNSEYIPEAYLYMGKAYIEEELLDKAEEILITAEKRYPELNRDHQITLLLITIAIRREGRSQAIALLEETRKTIKSEKLRLDLLLRTAELYIELTQYSKAVHLLKKAPRKREFPLQAYRMDRALLSCYTALDSLSLAYELIQKMIDNKRYTVHMDEMLFQKGAILHAMGRTDEAIKVFRKLTAGLDTATVAADTSRYKARALKELALIFQKDKKDYAKAASYLTLASMTRDTTVKGFAKKRLSAMERLRQLREDEGKEDSIPGTRFFAIGELFRFELDEPDSAFNQFVQICRDSLTDTSIVPKAISQAARIARDDLNDTLTADSLFRLLIKRYPSSEYAKIGQQELGREVTVKTREDSALDAYHHAEHLFYKENRVKDAIQTFFSLSKEYPELPIAEKSLFAAAWFSDNVLSKNRTAKMLYEKICMKYPESVYCTEQAKPRIKIVVDTLIKLEQLRKANAKKDAAGAAATVNPIPPDEETDDVDSQQDTQIGDGPVTEPGAVKNKAMPATSRKVQQTDTVTQKQPEDSVTGR